jgi:hypothetical protein
MPKPGEASTVVPSLDPALDLEFPATPSDCAALARAAQTAAGSRLSFADYFAWLAQFQMSPEELRSRPGPRGTEPFRL